jgi:WD40 repeat protein
VSDDFTRLTSLDGFERAARDGTLPQRLDELRRTADVLGLGSPRGEALSLLARALRVDLAFVVEHPHELFSCLYNRCAFQGDGESVLRQVVARWETERRTTGGVWVRSLRPLELTLDGPLLEEYRAHIDFPRALSLHSNGRLTVTHHGGAQGPSRIVDAWDRSTGRRCAPETIDVAVALDIDASPDGRFLVQRLDIGRTVKIIDAASGSTIVTLELGWARVFYVGFFPDGTRVVLAGDADEPEDGGRLTIVDLSSGDIVTRIDTPDRPGNPVVSPDGRRIAATFTRDVAIWDWERGEVVAGYTTAAKAIAFGADGGTLATANDGVVRVWEIRAGRHAVGLPGTRDYMCYGEFSRDGERVLTGQWLCDARSGQQIADLAHATSYYLEGAPTRHTTRLLDDLIVCLDRGISLWDLKTGTSIPRPLAERHQSFSYSHLVAISADGSRYAVTKHDRDFPPSDGPPELAEVEVFELASGRALSRFQITEASSVALSRDGTRLVVGSRDGVARVWFVDTGSFLASFTSHAPGARVDGVAFLLGDRWIASGARDDAVCVWDSVSGVETWRCPLDRLYIRWEQPGEKSLQWSATPGQVVDIEGWVGLRPPIHWAAWTAAGAIQVIDRRTRAVVARLAIDGGGDAHHFASHPDAPVWAGGPLHFKLEGVD